MVAKTSALVATSDQSSVAAHTVFLPRSSSDQIAQVASLRPRAPIAQGRSICAPQVPSSASGVSEARSDARNEDASACLLPAEAGERPSSSPGTALRSPDGPGRSRSGDPCAAIAAPP